MKAMVIQKIAPVLESRQPLAAVEMEPPKISAAEILIQVSACGVCHTELDEIEGRTPPPELPMIPGHEVIGCVVEKGADVDRFETGDRVGVAWIYSSCGRCEHCRDGNENLCADFRATGRDAHGGYAEYMKIHQHFAFPIPERFSDVGAAPLLCAGAIGYRSLRLTQLQNGQSLGLTGFGASAHLVLKMLRHQYPDSDVYVFARSPKEREFARELGAVWAGPTEATAPQLLHSIIDTTPAWKPIVEALKNLRPNGRLVINAIRKEENDKEQLLRLQYPEHLWLEKEIKSVANVATRDVAEFLELAAKMDIQPVVQEYALADANRALTELKQGIIQGAKVLRIS